MNEVLDTLSQRIYDIASRVDIETDEVDDCIGMQLRDGLTKRPLVLGNGAIDYQVPGTSPSIEGMVWLAHSAGNRNYIVTSLDEHGHEPRADVTTCSDDGDFHFDCNDSARRGLTAI
jgi:hypothetical protein